MIPQLRADKLVIGSATAAAAWWAEHSGRGQLDAGRETIAINNAWRLCYPRIDRWFRSCDFFRAGHVFPSAAERSAMAAGEIDSYTFKEPHWYGQLDGGIMFLNLLYSLINEAVAWGLQSRVFLVGCNFVYPPGGGHFYGAGTADPLRNGIDWLDGQLAGVHRVALSCGVQLFNATDGESRLPFPRQRP